jgi:hypothetical protein
MLLYITISVPKHVHLLQIPACDYWHKTAILIVQPYTNERLLVIRKLRHIASLLLLAVFLFPLLVKLEHHHEHFVCSAKHEKHLHSFHEKCAICDFEFTDFSVSPCLTAVPALVMPTGYCNLYRSANRVAFPDYFFLLRAPPVNQM